MSMGAFARTAPMSSFENNTLERCIRIRFPTSDVLYRTGGRRNSAPLQAHFWNTCGIAQFWFSGLLHLFRSESRGNFAENQPLGGDVNYREVGDDRIHAINSRERVSAGLYNFRRTVFRGVLHRHDQLLSADGNIHRTSDSAGAFR